MTTIPIPLAFDIILVRGTKFFSPWNRLFQSIGMLKHISFSHVLLCLGSGTVLHSPIGGVKLDRLLEIWDSKEYKEKKKVLRHKEREKIFKVMIGNDINEGNNFEDDANYTQDILKQSLEFCFQRYGKKYNFFSVFSKNQLRMKLGSVQNLWLIFIRR